ncbi:MAG: PEGA domain-containing protein [Nitrospirae bacterium]|nr:PEGA domain-containing protein [Nitrospirota bacterium]
MSVSPIRLFTFFVALLIPALHAGPCFGGDGMIPEPLAAWSAPGATSGEGRPAGTYTPGAAKSCKPALGEGTLVCNCDPPGASVFLDGELVGEAPVRKECLPAGEYTLRLVKPGFEPSESRVTVKKDVTLTVEDKLHEARGEVYVESEPPGVQVLFDGRRAGVTPVTITRVTEGGHEVRLTRDYFEDAVADVSMGRAERSSVALTLKRRILLVGMDGTGADGPDSVTDPVGAALSESGVVSVVRVGLGELAAGLVERGLEEFSLDFLKAGRTRLDIEDSAVLSGIMEQAGVELALVAAPAGDGGSAVRIMLYSTASDYADMAVLGPDGPEPGIRGFLAGWRRQQVRGRAAIGAEAAGRPEGAELTRLLKGYPAEVAGLAPGDVVVSVDGTAVTGGRGLAALLKPGVEQEVTALRGGDLFKVRLTPVKAPVEPDPEAPGYLVNLALVDSLAILDDTAGQTVREEVRGLAALTLGDAYAMAGDPEKAADAYLEARTGTGQGVCTGTALYRLGLVYEKLGRYDEAAAAYRKVLDSYPEATLLSADGPWAAPLAAGRLGGMKKR